MLLRCGKGPGSRTLNGTREHTLVQESQGSDGTCHSPLTISVATIWLISHPSSAALRVSAPTVKVHLYHKYSGGADKTHNSIRRPTTPLPYRVRVRAHQRILEE
jgi:hypothetical protein